MKLLVAGYGSIGRRHLRNLRQLGQNDLILLRSHRSTLPDDEIKGIPVVTNMAEAMAMKPAGVVVATPTALHMDTAVPAAEAGCTILLEKPVSDNFSRIPELRKALETNNGKLLMGFQYRFHPGLIRVKELLKAGAIGKPLSFHIEYGEYLPGWHPWEDYRKSYSATKELGGGVALTLIHPLDYLRWILGDPAWIWGFSGKISDLEIEVDDIAEIGIELANGMVGTVHLDYYSRPTRNFMEISGSEGIMRWTNDDSTVRVKNISSAQEQIFAPEGGFERNQLFLAEDQKFIDMAAGKALPSCTLEDGIKAEKMVDAVKRSWHEKRMIDFSEEQNFA